MWTLGLRKDWWIQRPLEERGVGKGMEWSGKRRRVRWWLFGMVEGAKENFA